MRAHREEKLDSKEHELDSEEEEEELDSKEQELDSEEGEGEKEQEEEEVFNSKEEEVLDSTTTTTYVAVFERGGAGDSEEKKKKTAETDLFCGILVGGQLDHLSRHVIDRLDNLEHLVVRDQAVVVDVVQLERPCASFEYHTKRKEVSATLCWNGKPSLGG